MTPCIKDSHCYKSRKKTHSLLCSQSSSSLFLFLLSVYKSDPPLPPRFSFSLSLAVAAVPASFQSAAARGAEPDYGSQVGAERRQQRGRPGHSAHCSGDGGAQLAGGFLLTWLLPVLRAAPPPPPHLPPPPPLRPRAAARGPEPHPRVGQ